jgi:tetratricopeptide (TPR) repeat protein
VLTDDLLFQFLVSEIAGQRGLLDVAKEGYLDMARKTRDSRIVRRGTEIAVFGRDQQAALELSRMWVELEPASQRALQTLVVLLIAQNHISEAAPYLERMLAGDQTEVGLMHLPGMFAKTRDTQAVLALIKKLTGKYPKVPEAHYAYAQAALNAEQPAEALAALKRADGLKPGWEPAAMLRAQILAKSSRTEALAFMKTFLETYPAARDVRLAYARMLVGANRLAESHEQFTRLAGEMPDSAEVAMAAGLLSLQMDKLDEAEKFLARAVELEREEEGRSVDFTAQYYLGQVAEERKAFDLAATRYRAIQAGEYLVPARTRLAMMLARQGKQSEALAELKSVKPANDVQGIQLVQAEADLLREAKNHDAVFALLDGAVKANPDNPDLLYDRAMAAEKVGKLEVVEADLRKVIKLKPDYAHAYNALGYTLAEKTNRLKEASELLEKALSLAPEDAFILDSMGWLHYRKGNLDKARDFLERAWRIRQDPEIAAHLGEVLWVRGDRDGAAKLWDNALQKHPQNDALLEILKKFKK